MRTTLFAIAGLLCLGGCATTAKDAATIASIHQPDGLIEGRLHPDDDRSDEHRLALAPHLSNLPEIEPDAVITLDPGSGALAPDMDAQLAVIADEMDRDDRLLVRLESYVPGGGSPALDLGIADRALRKVREHLVAQGVSPRRMLLGSFGGEHSVERHSRRHWVELYLVRRGYSSDEP